MPSLAGENPHPLHHLKQSRGKHLGLGGQLIPRDAQWVTPDHTKVIPWLGLGSSGTHGALCSWLALVTHSDPALFFSQAVLEDCMVSLGLCFFGYAGQTHQNKGFQVGNIALAPASSWWEKPRAAPALQPGLHLPWASDLFPWRFWEVTNSDSI